MNDFERINAPRVEKILKMLDTIKTSAKSNKAGDQLEGLLAPVGEALGTQTDMVPTSAAPAPPSQARGHQWANAVEMAREVDLEAGVAAMSVIATRVEQELYERRTGN